MKILVISNTTDERSGWGRYATSVVEETRRRGIECVVLSNVGSVAPDGKILSDEHPSLLEPFTISNAIKNILYIRKFLKVKGGVDIIHAFDCWPFAVYAAIATIGKGVPIFITGIGTYSIPPRTSGSKSILMQYAYAHAKEVFCISNYTFARVSNFVSKSNLSVVFLGATSLPNLSDTEENVQRNKFQIPEDAFPIIFTVGQIKHRKGQLDTMKAVSILKKKYPKILYLPIGSASDVAYVNSIREFVKANRIEDSLMIVDDCKDNKGLAFFNKIGDVFAMNSNNEGNHFEGFGLVFLEAAQFGKPAVGSSGCGIEDAIVDGRTGYLTKQGDSVDIADKLDKLISGDMMNFGENARNRAKEFTWKKTVDKYIASYTQK